MIYGVELVGGGGIILHADGFDHHEWIQDLTRGIRTGPAPSQQ